MKRSTGVQYLAGTAIAAASLVIFFRGVDFAQLKRELVQGRVVTLAACAFLSVFALVFRAMRWKVMLPERDDAHRGGLFPYVMVGFMVNNVLPARIGEAARALLLWRKNGYPAFVSIGSLVLERFLDVVLFISFFVVPVFVLGYTRPPIRSAAVVMGAIFICSLVALVLYGLYPSRARRLGSAGLRVVPGRFRERAEKVARELASNLHWISRPRKVLQTTVLSFAILLCYVVAIMFFLDDFGYTGLFRGMFVIAFAAMGAAIPLAPGYVGTMHAMLLQGLVIAGVGEERARAVAILYHAFSYSPVTLLGLYYFFRTDITFKDISQARSTLDA